MIELFVGGKEDGLPDAGRLDTLGLGEGSVAFMLHRAGCVTSFHTWHWAECGSGMELSGDGLVATKTATTRDFQLVTGGSPMTEGRHYWEVELTGGHATGIFGAARPGLDHDKGHQNSNDAYFIDGSSGALYGNGKYKADPQGHFAKGDSVGVLLDLNAGCMHIYRNGKRLGTGFTGEGATLDGRPAWAWRRVGQQESREESEPESVNGLLRQ